MKKPVRLADKITWVDANDGPELPGVLAVPRRDSIEPVEPVLGITSDELVTRVSQVPAAPVEPDVAASDDAKNP